MRWWPFSRRDRPAPARPVTGSGSRDVDGECAGTVPSGGTVSGGVAVRRRPAWLRLPELLPAVSFEAPVTLPVGDPPTVVDRPMSADTWAVAAGAVEGPAGRVRGLVDTYPLAADPLGAGPVRSVPERRARPVAGPLLTAVTPGAVGAPVAPRTPWLPSAFLHDAYRLKDRVMATGPQDGALLGALPPPTEPDDMPDWPPAADAPPVQRRDDAPGAPPVRRRDDLPDVSPVQRRDDLPDADIVPATASGPRLDTAQPVASSPADRVPAWSGPRAGPGVATEKVRFARDETSAPPEAVSLSTDVTERTVPAVVAARLERVLGVDTSGVTVRRGPGVDAAAAAFGARAFTVGEVPHVPDHMGPLEDGPGAAVLAHELAHVVQQHLEGDPPALGTEEGRRMEAEATAVEHWFAGTGPEPEATDWPEPPDATVVDSETSWAYTDRDGAPTDSDVATDIDGLPGSESVNVSAGPESTTTSGSGNPDRTMWTYEVEPGATGLGDPTGAAGWDGLAGSSDPAGEAGLAGWNGGVGHADAADLTGAAGAGFGGAAGLAGAARLGGAAGHGEAAGPSSVAGLAGDADLADAARSGGAAGHGEAAGPSGAAELVSDAGSAGPAGLTHAAGLAGAAGLSDGAAPGGAAGPTSGAGLTGPPGFVDAPGLVGGAGLDGSARLVGGAGLADATGLAGRTGLGEPAGLGDAAGLSRATGPAGRAGAAGFGDTAGLADRAGASRLGDVTGPAGGADAAGTGDVGRAGAGGLGDVAGLTGEAGKAGLGDVAGLTGQAGKADLGAVARLASEARRAGWGDVAELAGGAGKAGLEDAAGLAGEARWGDVAGTGTAGLGDVAGPAGRAGTAALGDVAGPAGRAGMAGSGYAAGLGEAAARAGAAALSGAVGPAGHDGVAGPGDAAGWVGPGFAAELGRGGLARPDAAGWGAPADLGARVDAPGLGRRGDTAAAGDVVGPSGAAGSAIRAGSAGRGGSAEPDGETAAGGPSPSVSATGLASAGIKPTRSVKPPGRGGAIGAINPNALTGPVGAVKPGAGRPTRSAPTASSTAGSGNPAPASVGSSRTADHSPNQPADPPRTVGRISGAVGNLPDIVRSATPISPQWTTSGVQMAPAPPAGPPAPPTQPGPNPPDDGDDGDDGAPAVTISRLLSGSPETTESTEDILKLLGDEPPRRWLDLDNNDHFLEIADRVYAELSARLRFDLLVERERAGSLMDLG
jgi:hypothetical protein